MRVEPIAAPTSLTTTTSWRAYVAWALCVLAIVLAGVSLALAILNSYDLVQSVPLLAVVTGALMGALVVTRRPDNVIGWLLLAGALCTVLGYACIHYALYGLVTSPGALPFALPVSWLPLIFTPAGVFTQLVVLPLLFPNGRPISPAWQRVLHTVIGVTIVLVVLHTVTPGPVQGVVELQNPLGIPWPEPVQSVLNTLQALSILGLFPVAAASLIVRYRRAERDERLQLKWLTYTVVAWTISVMLTSIIEPFNEPLYRAIDTVVLLLFMAIPLSVGVAVLRYRLYDIDALINRTLVYGALTACVVGLYVVVVGYLGALFNAQGNLLISLVATGIVAVLFQPLRERLQRWINRLLYGERDEPYTALARLGQRLEATLAPDEVLPTIVQAVAETLRLPYVAIALHTRRGDGETGRRGDGETGSDSTEIAASYGTPPASLPPHLLVSLPLAYQGEEVGALLLAPRAPGEAFSHADWQLLGHLARQAGVAAHAVALTVALQAGLAEVRSSRERLVTAQEEERRRIQRDLHDGLGPVLASMRMRLEATLDHAQQAAPALVGDLERLDALVGQAATDIRRLVHDLRPPALDQIGLAATLRQHVDRFRRETGLSTELTIGTKLALPAAAEVAIFRIMSEALNNVHKHARASHVTIRIDLLGAALLLHVRDNGAGGAQRGDGTGIASMRERAELLDGTLVLHSPPGAGTTIDVYIPLRGEH